MKKLSLIIVMLMSAGIFVNTYADDLDELNGLLEQAGNDNSNDSNSGGNDNSTQSDDDSTDTGSTDTDSSDNSSSDQSDDDLGDLKELDNNSDDNSSNEEKIVLSITWDVTANSVTLTFKKLDAYSNYKIYYSKSSEENLSEKDIIAEDGQENVEVTIDNLEPNTEYQFIAKAFDDNGNPVAATASDPVDVTTEQVHNAPSDNIIHDPVIKVDGSKITISYKPWVDVAKVQISLSEDAKTFKPLTTVDTSQTSYTFTAKSTWKKYIKIVPIAQDGTIWVCKVWKTTVDNNTFTATVKPNNTQKKIWEPKTGPEMYLLIILAIFAYVVYALRKRA